MIRDIGLVEIDAELTADEKPVVESVVRATLVDLATCPPVSVGCIPPRRGHVWAPRIGQDNDGRTPSRRRRGRPDQKL